MDTDDDEYQRMMDEAQQNQMASPDINYDNADKFLSDEVNFTHRIITDDVKVDVLDCLDSMFFKT